MLPVLPFVIGGVVGLVAGVVAKTIIDNKEEFVTSQSTPTHWRPIELK